MVMLVKWARGQDEVGLNRDCFHHLHSLPQQMATQIPTYQISRYFNKSLKLPQKGRKLMISYFCNFMRTIKGQLLFRKDFLKFSFTPKNGRKYFCISALAYRKRSNKKKECKSQNKILQLVV